MFKNAQAGSFNSLCRSNFWAASWLVTAYSKAGAVLPLWRLAGYRYSSTVVDTVGNLVLPVSQTMANKQQQRACWIETASNAMHGWAVRCLMCCCFAVVAVGRHSDCGIATIPVPCSRLPYRTVCRKHYLEDLYSIVHVMRRLSVSLPERCQTTGSQAGIALSHHSAFCLDCLTDWL